MQPASPSATHSQLTAIPLQWMKYDARGRLCLDKYALMPQRRCSYFHSFVWECKFMCVIPVCYINARGPKQNEYSHMHAPAHTADSLKSIMRV